MAKQRTPFSTIEENEAILAILDGTSAEIGQNFFVSLVKNLSKVLNTHGAWVTEFFEKERRMSAKAFYLGDGWVDNFQYPVDGTPCETVVTEKRLVHIRDNLFQKYKGNPELKDFGKTGAVSYLGVPFEDSDGTILGHLSVIDTEPIPEDQEVFNIFRIFANRASAEMRRLRAEKETLEREEKLIKLFDSAMDAIVELDRDFKVTRINSAASKIFGLSGEKVQGRLFNHFLTGESSQKLLTLTESLDTRPEGEKFIWIPQGLRAVSADGLEFPAEATLSRFEMGDQHFYTLILRNVNERLISEQRIQSLTIESEYLKEELKSLTETDGIIGDSQALMKVMGDVKKVAGTDASVLILGETGTGKELVARSIHSSSQRSDKPFIKVNCPAISSNLIESEFFGHEQGAFTGATKKRDGRFKVADGGTIFLDEIGEIPIDLQSKLLRVLQEGEFEPVGSSNTIKVDVRVIAATNRDLLQEVKEGKFREDLYYRLNVFQINVPPLRERGADIEKLANAFLGKFSKRNGINLQPLSDQDIIRLNSYNWPGNIRELQNVVERAVITSIDGRLNLEQALPETSGLDIPEIAASIMDNENVISDKELKDIEKANIQRALNKTDWKISGKEGAAAMLGIPTSTLNSKIKSFDIKRPQ
ncbi:MAG: sigma 54-interacting transcriptional regulator [Thermodesulfobacteriota bacterium]